MIDWLLKHPMVIFVIIAGVSSLLKKLKPELDEEKPATPADSRTLQKDFDEIERTRRIQEEIRRKIAERRGLVSAAPAPVAAPEAPKAAFREASVVPSSHYHAEPPPLAQEEAINPILERQRALAEQLAALQARHATVSRASQEAWAPALATPAVSVNFDETRWLGELRNARVLRKAIILREVLGPPVGLR